MTREAVFGAAVLLIIPWFARGAASMNELSVRALELYRRGNCAEAKPLFEQMLARQPKNAAVRRLIQSCDSKAPVSKLRRTRRDTAMSEGPAKPSPVGPAAGRRATAPRLAAPPIPPPLGEASRPIPSERELAGPRLYDAERHIKEQRFESAEPLLEALVNEKPGLTIPKLRLAEIYSQTKRFGKAAGLYGLLASAPGASPEMRLREAQNLAWDKNLPEAARSYERYLELDPNHAEARLGLANVLFWANDYPNAIRAYRRYIELRPEDKEARLSMAKALLWTGQYKEALPEFEQLKKAAPTDPLIDMALAQCYEHLDRPEDALEALERTIRRAPDQKEAIESRNRLVPHILLRNAYRMQESGDYAGAAKAFQAYLEKNPKDDETVLRIARLYSWAKDNAGAIRQYEAYLERKPHDYEAMRELARIQMSLPDFAGARKTLGAIVSAGKGQAEDYAGLVNAHLWEGQYDAAQPFLERLIEIDPDHETARAARKTVVEKARTQELEGARVLAATGRFSDALQAYRAFTARYGADRDVELAMARLYAWDNQAGKAVQAYHEYLSRYPDDAPVRLEVADLQRWNGKTGAAEADYRAVLNMDPRNAHALFGLTQIADQRGDDRFSVYRAYQGVLALEPGNRTSRRRLAEIAPQVSPAVQFRQQSFQDSDEFHRSISTIETAFPFRGGLRVSPLFRYGYFNQFREVSGRVCGSGPDGRPQDPAVRRLSEEICANRGSLKGVGGGLALDLEPNQKVLFHAEASSLKFGGPLQRWNPMLAAELVVRPGARKRFVLAFRRRDAAYDVNTISTLHAGITSDTLEASFEMPLSERWNVWMAAGAARYSASRDSYFGSNLQRRVTVRANYQVTPWMTAGYYVRVSAFREYSPLYFSPEFYGVSGLSWTWDKPFANGLRFVGDVEAGYGRINRYDTGGVNNLELSVFPSIVWDIRPDLNLRLGYRFGRGRSSAFGSPVYSTGNLDFGLGTYLTPALPRPNLNRIEIR